MAGTDTTLDSLLTDVVLDDLDDELNAQSVADPTDTDAKPDDEVPPDTEDSAKAPTAPSLEVLQAENEELHRKMAGLEKQRSDTASDWHEQHDARVALEKKVADLESRVTAAAAQKAAASKSEDDGWDDAEDADDSKASQAIGQLTQQVETLTKSLADMQQEERSRRATEKWDKAEVSVRGAHDDYEAVVSNFERAYEADPALQALFKEDPGPETAYRMGKELMDAQLMRDDPAAYKANLRAEIERELAAKADAPDDDSDDTPPVDDPEEPEDGPIEDADDTPTGDLPGKKPPTSLADTASQPPGSKGSKKGNAGGSLLDDIITPSANEDF